MPNHVLKSIEGMEIYIIQPLKVTLFWKYIHFNDCKGENSK